MQITGRVFPRELAPESSKGGYTSSQHLLPAAEAHERHAEVRPMKWKQMADEILERDYGIRPDRAYRTAQVLQNPEEEQL